MSAPLTDPAAAVCAHSKANRLARLAWNVVWLLFFRPSPPSFWRWRMWLLRRFGATIESANLHPSVRVWAPWRLKIGKEVWIDSGVNLYNAFGLEIHDRNVISQGVFLCTATHDYNIPNYPLTGNKLIIESDCWLAAEAFIAPSVQVIGQGTVVGARAVVVKQTPALSILGGNPAKVIKQRNITSQA